MSFNSSRPKPLGKVVSISIEHPSSIVKTNQGNFRITVYSKNIINVCASPHDTLENFSYAVVAQPSIAEANYEELEQIIKIKTDSIHLLIQKANSALSFLTEDGKIINEDDPLGISWIGEQVTCYKKLQEGERFIGLGEKTGDLDRRGAAYQNWNTDAYAYIKTADPLYSSIPFYIGIHGGLCYGIFFDNTHKSHFNFGASNKRFASFSADSGEMNYYFIYGNSVQEIIEGYTWLTGRMEMPPKWSIGYQQCRYSYYPDKEVLNVANTFREKDIPADAIVFDIHYMEKYKIFTWDKKHFSNPAAMIDSLKKLGFQIVIMCDPGIKVEPGYEPYDDGIDKNVFIKFPDGENYSGQVWPGWCHFPDFTNPKTREWWAEKFHDYVKLGVEGFWNDMNEIATWGNSIPENLEFNFEGNKATSRRGRNVYGMQMARSTYEGTKILLKGKRPFNLTRSGFAGIQRYSAMWTGDNVSYDEHMMLGIRIVNSFGLSGVAFAGYDTGGFVGEANSKLFARWISIAALSPFFRTHSMINTRDSEPWSYGEEVENISRNYIKFRYQLMPYIYSLFYEASQTGMPIQRSLAINYSHDHQVYNGLYQHQYLFGPNILVAPVESFKDLVKVYFPEGDWYDLYTGKNYRGNQETIIECPIHKLPVFVRAGSILPMQKSLMNTSEKTDELILHVYFGKHSSEFTFYLDDGETFQYQHGDFTTRKLIYDSNQNKILITPSEGKYLEHFKTIMFVFHGFQNGQVSLNNSVRPLDQVTHSFFSPLEKYDPINEPDSMGEESVAAFSVDYTRSALEVKW